MRWVARFEDVVHPAGLCGFGGQGVVYHDVEEELGGDAQDDFFGDAPQGIGDDFLAVREGLLEPDAQVVAEGPNAGRKADGAGGELLLFTYKYDGAAAAGLGHFPLTVFFRVGLSTIDTYPADLA